MKLTKTNLKQIIREEIQKLNEASSLSGIGATPSQIKTAHTKLDVQFDAKEKFEKTTNKKDLMKIFKSDKGKDSFYKESVVGFDTDGNMTIAGKGKSHATYSIYKISTDGKILERQDEKAPGRVISHFKGIKAYYISRAGSMGNSNTRNKFTGEQANYEDEVVNVAVKFLNKKFHTLVGEMKNKIVTAINSNKLEEAHRYLDKLVIKRDWGPWGVTNINNFLNNI